MDKKEESKFYYNQYKSKGICTACHRNKVSDGHTICDACLERKRQYRLKNIERIKAADKARYAKCKADGICCYCRKEPAIPGRVYCTKCAEKISESGKIYYQRRAAREAKANVR